MVQVNGEGPKMVVVEMLESGKCRCQVFLLGVLEMLELSVDSLVVTECLMP